MCNIILVYKKYYTSSSTCQLHYSNLCYHMTDQYESIPLNSLTASLHTCELSSNTLSLPWILVYSSPSGCMAPTKRVMDRQISNFPPHTHPEQPGLPPLHLNIHPCCCIIFPFNQDLPTFVCILGDIGVIPCKSIILCD